MSLYRPTKQCPDDLTLSAYQDQGLDDMDTKRVAQHIALCRRCRQILTIEARPSRSCRKPEYVQRLLQAAKSGLSELELTISRSVRSFGGIGGNFLPLAAPAHAMRSGTPGTGIWDLKSSALPEGLDLRLVREGRKIVLFVRSTSSVPRSIGFTAGKKTERLTLKPGTETTGFVLTTGRGLLTIGAGKNKKTVCIRIG